MGIIHPRDQTFYVPSAEIYVLVEPKQPPSLRKPSAGITDEMKLEKLCSAYEEFINASCGLAYEEANANISWPGRAKPQAQHWAYLL